MPLHLEFLTQEHLPLVEPWFEDAETQRRVSGPDWPSRLLTLMAEMPGQEFRGRIVTRRVAYVAFDDRQAVGLADIEMYDDMRASILVVIAPHMRGRGYCLELHQALVSRPELSGVRALEAGIEPDNTPSLRCAKRAGFRQVGSGPDDEGFLNFELELRAEAAER